MHFLNLFPKICPRIINSALKTLADNDYIEKSYVVMNIGAVDNVKAMALELSFDETGAATDATNLVEKVNNLLSIFANAATNKKWYLAEPIALRFVAGADAYLAPHTGRTTCMAELDLLVGIRNGEYLLREVKARCVRKVLASECIGASILTLFLVMRYMICSLNMTVGCLCTGN